MRASPRVVSGSGCGHNTSNRWRDAHTVRGLPARIAAIGDDQHRCDLLLQQHQGLAEALTTATGQDNQGVGWMGGIG